MDSTKIPPARTLGFDDWNTPPEVFDPVHRALNFDFDAAANDSSVARLPLFIDPKADALTCRWADYGQKAWLNPPYGRDLPKWLEAARRAIREGCSLVAVLCMANTDTRYWQQQISGKAANVVFLSPRVRFVRPNGDRMSSAPKGSALIVYDDLPWNQNKHTYWQFDREPFPILG